MILTQPLIKREEIGSEAFNHETFNHLRTDPG